MRAYEGTSGETLWTYDSAGSACFQLLNSFDGIQLSPAGKYVYVIAQRKPVDCHRDTGDIRILALDTLTGESVWHQDLPLTPNFACLNCSLAVAPGPDAAEEGSADEGAMVIATMHLTGSGEFHAAAAAFDATDGRTLLRVLHGDVDGVPTRVTGAAATPDGTRMYLTTYDNPGVGNQFVEISRYNLPGRGL